MANGDASWARELLPWLLALLQRLLVTGRSLFARCEALACVPRGVIGDAKLLLAMLLLLLLYEAALCTDSLLESGVLKLVPLSCGE